MLVERRLLLDIAIRLCKQYEWRRREVYQLNAFRIVSIRWLWILSLFLVLFDLLMLLLLFVELFVLLLKLDSLLLLVWYFLLEFLDFLFLFIILLFRLFLRFLEWKLQLILFIYLNIFFSFLFELLLLLLWFFNIVYFDCNFVNLYNLWRSLGLFHLQNIENLFFIDFQFPSPRIHHILLFKCIYDRFHPSFPEIIQSSFLREEVSSAASYFDKRDFQVF